MAARGTETITGSCAGPPVPLTVGPVPHTLTLRGGHSRTCLRKTCLRKTCAPPLSLPLDTRAHSTAHDHNYVGLDLTSSSSVQASPHRSSSSIRPAARKPRRATAHAATRHSAPPASRPLRIVGGTYPARARSTTAPTALQTANHPNIPSMASLPRAPARARRASLPAPTRAASLASAASLPAATRPHAGQPRHNG
jgi:hypothetical protein